MLMTNEFRMVNADASSGTCRMDGQWQCNEPQGGQQACIALVDGYIGDGFVGDWYEATKLVRESDMTIVSVGMFTKESKDRLTLALEQSQDALIDMARVTSQSKPNVTPIVVVMSSPGAQLTPWRFDISAICVNFGTGQAHGLALVDVLFGDVNPSARLPVTFPNMDNEQRWTPSQYPGVANVSTYSEKLRVGYRWYNQYMVMPAFPFGHGLSYTSFGYSDFILKSMQDGSVMATVTITNTGNYSGVETVQLYVTFPTAADEPPRILKGFQKTAVLAPQQLAVITFRVSSRDLSVWSVDTHDWSAVHGTFVFYAAASSADIRQMQTISISN
jgi:beta-glucosidase